MKTPTYQATLKICLVHKYEKYSEEDRYILDFALLKKSEW